MASRFSPFVATALALHVGVFVLAHFAPPRISPLGPAAAPVAEWVDAPELAPPEPAKSEPSSPDPSVPTPAHDTKSKQDTAHATTSPIPAPPPPDVAPIGPAKPGEDGWSLPSFASKPVDISLDRTAFARGLLPVSPVTAAPQQEEAPPPPRGASRTGGLSEALAAHDVAIGMGHGGPVVSAVHDAVGTSLVPNESAATIEVVFDGNGRPIEARVVSSKGGESEWAEAARAILASLAGRAMHIPSRAAGLAVLVHVEVAMRSPSGSRSAVAPSAGTGTVGIRGDLSDIGQHARRVVSAQIVDERLL